MNKKDVEALCQQLAAEHSGWIYQSHIFKNKTLGHSEIWIDPSWVLHLAAEPSIKVFNQSVNKIIREGFKDLPAGKWTTRMLITRPGAHNNHMTYRELVHTLSDAEAYIRDFFQRGLNLIERYFYSEDEKIFLSSYPIVGEFPLPCSYAGYEGLGNCLARAVILDFDYVERFVRADFPTDRPIYEPYRERVAEWLPTWKQRAFETGSILKPSKP